MNKVMSWHHTNRRDEDSRGSGNKSRSLGRVMANCLCVAGLLVLQSIAQATSLDCATVFTQVEKSVCDSPKLGTLNDELDALYQDELQRTPDAGGAREDVKGRQNRWLRESRNVCTDSACLERAYGERLAVLRESKALYDAAKQDAEQEDRNPPPGNEISAATSTPSERQSEPAQSANQQAASSPDLAPSQPSVLPSGTTESMSSGVVEKTPMIILVIALLQVPLTFWVVFRKTKFTKGVVRGVTTAGVASSAAFITLAAIGVSIAPEEDRAKWSASGRPTAANLQVTSLENPNAKPVAVNGAGRFGEVVQVFPALAGLRYGMSASELPSGYRRNTIAFQKAGDEERHNQFMDQIGIRREVCYYRDGGESGIPGVTITKVVTCFDAQNDILFSAAVHFPKEITSSPLVMKVKQRVDQVAGNSGSPEQDNGMYGYTKYQWRTKIGAEAVAFTLWSVPSGTHMAQNIGARYKSGVMEPIQKATEDASSTESTGKASQSTASLNSKPAVVVASVHTDAYTLPECESVSSLEQADDNSCYTHEPKYAASYPVTARLESDPISNQSYLQISARNETIDGAIRGMTIECSDDAVTKATKTYEVSFGLQNQSLIYHYLLSGDNNKVAVVAGSKDIRGRIRIDTEMDVSGRQSMGLRCTTISVTHPSRNELKAINAVIREASQINAARRAMDQNMTDPLVRLVAANEAVRQHGNPQCGPTGQEIMKDWYPIVKNQIQHFGIAVGRQTVETHISTLRSMRCLPDGYAG